MAHTCLSITLRVGACAMLLCAGSHLNAGILDYGVRNLPDKGGTLEDEGPVGAKVEVWWTTVRDNQNIDSNSKVAKTIPPNPHGADRNKVSFNIPKTATFTKASGSGSEVLPVTDFHQKVSHPSITRGASGGEVEGATNYLGGAAYVFLGPNHMRMSFLEDAIYDMVGDDVSIGIPDGFGDTNLDGMIGDGDVIYSLVNLYEFLPAAWSWSFGQTFEVVNGVCAALPGMGFGTAPMIFDEDAEPFGEGRMVISGMDNPEPYTGTIRIDASHTVSIPTPGAAVLMGLAGLLVARRRR